MGGGRGCSSDTFSTLDAYWRALWTALHRQGLPPLGAAAGGAAEPLMSLENRQILRESLLRGLFGRRLGAAHLDDRRLSWSFLGGGCDFLTGSLEHVLYSFVARVVLHDLAGLLDLCLLTLLGDNLNLVPLDSPLSDHYRSRRVGMS